MPAQTWGRVAGTAVLCLLVGASSGCELLASHFGSDQHAPSTPPDNGGAEIARPGRSLDEMLGQMEAAYRLKPDQRFVRALEALPTLMGDGARIEVATHYGPDGWEVRASDRTLGRLDALPDFNSQYAILKREAKRLADAAPAGGEAGPGAPDKATPRMDPNEPWRTLRELDNMVGTGRPGPLQAQTAARALLHLRLDMVDDLGVADAVSVQALAGLAVAEALGDKDLLSERAVLARVLGYGGDAERLAAMLDDASSPSGVFARGDDLAAMEKAARRGEPFASFLYAHTLDTRSLCPRARAWMDQLPKGTRGSIRLVSLRSACERSPRYSATLTATTLTATRRALSGNDLPYDDAPLDLKRLVALVGGGFLELALSDIDRLERQLGGRYLPPPVLAAYFRAGVLSGLDRMGHYYNHALNSEKAATGFGKSLGVGGGDYGAQFHRYYEHHVLAEAHAVQISHLVADMRDLTLFGAHALGDTFRALREAAPFDAAWRQAIKEFVKRCDTRPACRSTLAFTARRDLMHLDLAERLEASVAEQGASEFSYDVLKHALVQGDTKQVRALVGDPSLGPRLKASALSDRRTGLDAAELETLHRQASKEDAGTFTATRHYANFLVDQDRASEAELLIRAWLSDHEAEGRFAVLIAKTSLAWVLQKQGKLIEAWTVTEGLVPSMYGPALRRAALIHLARGNHAEAEALARRCLKRYENGSSVATLARVLWAQRAHQKAAEVIAHAPRTLTTSDYIYELAPSFGKAMIGLPPDEARKAMLPLVQAGMDGQMLGYLPGNLSRRGEYERAIAAREPIRLPGLAQLLSTCSAYGDVRAWKGEAQALSWLKEHVRPKMRAPLSQLCYEAGHPRVAWLVTPDPPEGDPHADYVWLLRAAALAQEPKPDPSWVSALDGYYGRATASFYNSLGQHLRGSATAKEVWQGVTARDRIAEAAYFLALRAKTEGDYARAVQLLQVVMENGQSREGETRWSYHQLYRWREAGRSLEQLARERI